MRNKYSQKEVNDFISDLFQTYSESINTAPDISSPYFMARVNARIKDLQNCATQWESGVIRAQNWLVAFSLIAFIFFVSNIVLTQIQAPSKSNQEIYYSESLSLSEHGWDYLNDEPIQIREAVSQ